MIGTSTIGSTCCSCFSILEGSLYIDMCGNIFFSLEGRSCTAAVKEIYWWDLNLQAMVLHANAPSTAPLNLLPSSNLWAGIHSHSQGIPVVGAGIPVKQGFTAISSTTALFKWSTLIVIICRLISRPAFVLDVLVQ